METHDFIEWLKTEMKSRGWRSADLARAAGLYPTTFNRVLTRSRKAGPSVCVAIAQALEIDPVFVFRKAGLLPPASEGEPTPAQNEALQLLSQLSEEEQVYAVRMLQGLVATKGSAEDDG